MKYFITTYEDMILGGGETYYFRMVDCLAEKGYQSFLLLPKWVTVDGAVLDEVNKRNITILRYKNILKDKDIKKLLNEKVDDILGIVYTKERYIRLRKLFEYNRVEYRLFLYLIALNRAVLKHEWGISRRVMRTICMPIIDSRAYVGCDNVMVEVGSKYSKLPCDKMLCLNVGVFIKELDILQIQGKSKSKFDILTVARFDFPQKGYLLGLVEDFGKLVKKCAYARLIIVGYGDGQNQLLDAIDKLEDSAQKRIEILGKVEYSKLNQLYKDADLYIGMGTTLMEAASVGTLPIVASVFQYANYSPGYFAEARTMGVVAEGRYTKYADISQNKKYHFYELMLDAYEMTDEEYIEKRVANYNYYKDTYSIDVIMENFLNHDYGKPCSVNLIQRMLFYYFDCIQNLKIFVKYLYRKLKK